jgi:hypothetical protein
VTEYIFPLDSNSQGNHNGYRSCYVARLILENKDINKKKKKRKIKKKKKKTLKPILLGHCNKWFLTVGI